MKSRDDRVQPTLTIRGDHGKLYDDGHAEEVTFGDGSDSGRNWHEWTTARLQVEFDVETI